MRVFGPELAEVPLLATRPDLRGNGLGRTLLGALESHLAAIGVTSIAMPALPMGAPVLESPAAAPGTVFVLSPLT